MIVFMIKRFVLILMVFLVIVIMLVFFYVNEFYLEMIYSWEECDVRRVISGDVNKSYLNKKVYFECIWLGFYVVIYFEIYWMSECVKVVIEKFESVNDIDLFL